MKRTYPILLGISLASIAILVACSGAAPAPAAEAAQSTAQAPAAGETAPAVPVDPGTMPALPDSELPKAAVLALGILKLEGTPLAVDATTAAQTLPLWQMLRELNSSGTSAQDEIDAVVQQIQESLSAEQVQAIAAMNLSQADLMAAMQQLAPIQSTNGEGTPMPRIGQGGNPGGQPGNGPGGGPGGMPMPEGPSVGSPEGGQGSAFGQSGTPMAGRGRAGENGTPRFLLDAVISLLEGRSTGG